MPTHASVGIDGNSTKTDSLDINDPRDRIVCMATIEGFAALRSPDKGIAIKCKPQILTSFLLFFT
jgi:hypothetical protein